MLVTTESTFYAILYSSLSGWILLSSFKNNHLYVEFDSRKLSELYSMQILQDLKVLSSFYVFLIR